jgi:Ca2+-binding EF-hand superfamily protein
MIAQPLAAPCTAGHAAHAPTRMPLLPLDARLRAMRAPGFDKDGGGTLDADELRRALPDIGVLVDTPEANAVLGLVAVRPAGGLTMGAFRIVARALKGETPKIQQKLQPVVQATVVATGMTMGGTGETVGAVFRRMDVDGGGTLDAKELRAALTDIGLPLNTPAAVQALERAEAAGGGLDVKAFKAIVKALKAAPSATAIVDQGYEAEAGES